jgi:gliding motility-associated protein GldM
MGGAKNCPETPRQKMISMMYLVLTAMLALNVSAAILNGYVAVDDSLHATIETMVEANHDTYRQFKVALDQNPEKVQSWYDKALEIQKSSDAFYNYVQNFKD